MYSGKRILCKGNLGKIVNEGSNTQLEVTNISAIHFSLPRWNLRKGTVFCASPADQTWQYKVCRRVLRKRSIASLVSGLASQPRGLREKICTASQPVSLATINDSSRPPLMGAWNPI